MLSRSSKAIGMPELYKLITPLGVLQDLGYKVVLLTDGRLSGVSGKVPIVVNVTPEVYSYSLLNKIQHVDIIHVNGQTSEMTLFVDEQVLTTRVKLDIDLIDSYSEFGRELFTIICRNLTSAEEGVVSF